MPMTVEATIALFVALGICGGLFYYLISEGEKQERKKNSLKPQSCEKRIRDEN